VEKSVVMVYNKLLNFAGVTGYPGKAGFEVVQAFMKKLNAFLNILMGSFFGVFIGDLIANYRNYQQFHEIYDTANSAPWCYGAISSLILFIVVVIICVIIKLIIRNKTKQ